jgi:hypothetical protein
MIVLTHLCDGCLLRSRVHEAIMIRAVLDTSVHYPFSLRRDLHQAAVDAPRDWSSEHDHYLHGTPKQRADG